MTVKWIKLATNLFDDEKIRLIKGMPKGDTYISIWVELLCLAGRQNSNGVFIIGEKPYTMEMFATVFNRSVKTINEAFRILIDYGLLTQVNGVYAITNWEKHQNLEQLKNEPTDRAQYMREYMKKRRGNVNKNVNNVNKNVNNVNKNVNFGVNKNVNNVSTIEREREKEIRDGESESVNISPPDVNTKNVYGQFNNVMLTEDEFSQLQQKYTNALELIDKLSLYLESTGKTYKSHYATLIKWAKEDASSGKAKKTNFTTFGGDEGMNDFEKKMLLQRIKGE